MGKTQDELVKCHQCRHYTDLKDAQELLQTTGYNKDNATSVYFCRQHIKNYDRINLSSFRSYSRPQYYKDNVEVSEDGTPYGYEKKDYNNFHAKEWAIIFALIATIEFFWVIRFMFYA